ncbi:MAG: hypothetical protein ACD_2C00165G0002 [uncultured bacterium (gcode 4)]|uniref:Uncharacterized protein n=1 Tax=uncultured bacterium (gcode 4) TaxID=1234023 RepID=K2FE87_9BACT|nr:MAG: hypothetical protein ACD_2C00165G0002 [uncultured bacterium (gcode 4)]
MNKIIIAIILAFQLIWMAFGISEISYAETDINQSELMVGKQETLFDIWKDKVDLTLWVDAEDVNIKDNFIRVVQKYALWVVFIIAITMFIYIWFQLATAEWKQDQFTKAMKALVYLAVWLAVIPLAYIVVKITTWFTF